MHRDIKPDNILVDVCNNRLVLADFGSAKFVKEGESHATYMCTRFYRAPCLILDRDMYSTSIDIWSFGCLGRICLWRTTSSVYVVFLPIK